MKKLLFSLILLTNAACLMAQNVGINTSGAAPAASAMLDIASTSMGVLLPQVALTATNAAGPITSPATGLLVYNTATAGSAPNNVVPGYYYNSGTGASPVWIRFAGGNTKAWTLSGNAGTTAGTDFIGTTDAQDFVIKTGVGPTERARFNNTSTAFELGADGTAALPILTWTADPNTGIWRQGSDKLSITTGGTEAWRFGSSQELLATSQGSAASPILSWTTDGNTGIFRGGADYLGFTTGGTERLQIDANGNLGVGTTPTASSVLDMSSVTTKGVEFPNVALSATTTATLASPATGVVVYNTATAGAGGTAVAPGYYYYDGTKWVAFEGINGKDWSLLGNAGTSAPATPGTYGTSTFGATENFIGTTDAQPLTIGTNNIERMRVLSSGFIGIGTAVPSYPFHIIKNDATYAGRIENPNATGIALIGRNTTASGTSSGSGLYGYTSQSLGNGVWGRNTHADGAAGYFDNSAAAGSATGFGVYSATAQSAGVGVYGSLNSGGSYIAGAAVEGYALSTIAAGLGICGVGDNATGAGVYGRGNGSTGSGVFATTSGSSADAVYATATGSSGYGVYASSTGTTAAVGVAGVVGDDNATALIGFNTSTTNPATAVVALGGNSAASYSSAGKCVGASLVSKDFGSISVRDEAGNTNGEGAAMFYGTNDAANYAAVSYRTGGTWYKIYGTGSVSTIVEDTEKKKHVMYCPESPEIMFQDFGQGKLINGKASISFDEILKNNIKVDETSKLKVFIQLEGECNGVYVTNKTGNGFDVVELMNGKSNTEFTWFISATRKDWIDEKTGEIISKHEGIRFPITESPKIVKATHHSLLEKDKSALLNKQELIRELRKETENEK